MNMVLKNRLPAERRLELVHVSLMRDKRFAFFAGLFMVGVTTITEEMITAKTNGRDAFYGRTFVDMLSDKELAFLVLHENMHKCYRHLTTWRALYEVDRSIANQACDYVINIQLRDMDSGETMISMPRDQKTRKNIGLIDPRFRGMDTKQVFDILMQEKEKGGGGKGGDEPGSGGEEGEQTDSGSDSPGLDEHDWQGAKEMTAETIKELTQEIESALRQGGIYAGKVGGNMLRSVQDMLEPKVDWREVLRRFVRTSLKDRDSPSWRKAHKNYLWQDIILPSIVGKRMKHLVIAMDTSGSIQGEMLSLFMGELNKVVTTTNPDRVDVLYWDTEVAGHETHKGAAKSIVSKTKPKGGGGTDPDCVPAFMLDKKLEKADALVVLTDGYMTSDSRKWAGLGLPILWCIIGSDSFKIPRGQVVCVTKD
jgi:predicted metal-dependent peptidase